MNLAVYKNAIESVPSNALSKIKPAVADVLPLGKSASDIGAMFISALFKSLLIFSLIITLFLYDLIQ